MLFKTQNLFIRELKDTDLDAFCEMQGNPNVMRYVGGKVDTRDECQTQIRDLQAAYTKPNPNLLVWAVCQQSDGAFVGTAAIVYYKNGDHEIGYRFLERYWGKGYGKEVANGLIDYAIHDLQLSNVVAYVDKKNLASVKILDQSALPFQKEYFNKDDNCMDRMYRWERGKV